MHGLEFLFYWNGIDRSQYLSVWNNGQNYDIVILLCSFFVIISLTRNNNFGD